MHIIIIVLIHVETEYVVWDTALSNLGYIRGQMELHPEYQKYVVSRIHIVILNVIF